LDRQAVDPVHREKLISKFIIVLRVQSLVSILSTTIFFWCCGVTVFPITMSIIFFMNGGGDGRVARGIAK
jgi:hypothetical protein